jgi:hypothetical protein
MKTDQTKFEFRASQDGQYVMVKATQPNQKPILLAIPHELTGQFVAGLLGASVECARLNKPTAQALSEGNEQAELVFVQANGVSLQDVTGTPDVAGLAFQFGKAQVGIGLNRAALKPLGTALLAASVDSSKPQ